MPSRQAPFAGLRLPKPQPARRRTRGTLIRALAVLLLTLGSVSAARAADPGVYRVPLAAREALSRLAAPVDHDRLDGDYLVELTADQVQALRAAGFEPVLAYASAAEMDRQVRAQEDFRAFNTYEQIRTGMYACAAAYPGIARLYVLGTSLEGREILALKISDNPQAEEDEPALVFWGGIHGNEYAGGEMPYLYALYMCQNYGIDTEVTRRVNDNETWCIPMINPDGRANGVRGNHNGIDLNRDFGFQWNAEGGSTAPCSQVETRIVREFCRAHDVTLSLTFHCSGDIVFYPWGYSSQATPDLATIDLLSAGYAAAANYAYGNSWADYETHGELIDELYGARGAICVTVEINNSSSIIAQTFERNRLGMNWISDQAAAGLHGNITDAQSGAPLEARVRIVGNVEPSYSDPAGHVHRVLRPGTYSVEVSAPGHQSVVVPNLVVAAGAPAHFTAALEPGTADYAFLVTAVSQKDPSNAHQNATVPSSALGAPDGVACSLGATGTIVLDFGAGHEIGDAAGNDFTVTEAIFAADPTPETYRVYAGDAYTQSVLVGTATGTASFDLGAAGVTSTRYLKIVDQSGASPSLPYAGVDLDAVTVLHSAPSAVDDPVVGPGVGPGVGPNAGLTNGLELRISPQPLVSTATIRFTLTEAGLVRANLYDVAGRLVRSLLGGAQLGPGAHEVMVDASGLESGTYYYRVSAATRLDMNDRSDARVGTGKLVVLR